MKAEKFSQSLAVEQIEKYLEQAFENEICPIKKPFYHYTEWSGWRFYLKAIKYRDWKSIKGHIKNNYFTANDR